MDEFKVGDRVRVTTHHWGVEQFGKTGTVHSTNNAKLPIGIRYDDALPGGFWSNTYRVEDLELIPPVAPAFKIGDRVKLIAECDGAQPGHYGVVKSGPDREGDFLVEFGPPFENGHGSSEREWFCGSKLLAHALASPARPCIVDVIGTGLQHLRRPGCVQTYPDRATATTAAERMAASLPGQSFGVFELVSTSAAGGVVTTEAV